MDAMVEAERARCLSWTETYDGQLSGVGSMVLTRIENIIRNGIVPESFAEQMSSEDPTQYSDPATVQEERQRCITCIDLVIQSAPSGMHSVLSDLRNKFASGLPVH